VPAALCFHKGAAAAAALCVFDMRAAAPLVSRYATHHRSLAPHLESVREHFLLTSHAGTPLAVWDRRQGRRRPLLPPPPRPAVAPASRPGGPARMLPAAHALCLLHPTLFAS
jgi:hypothetical protein